MVQRVCRVCSTVTETDKTFCPECGTSYFREPSTQSPPVGNGKATASLIIGIIGLLLFGLILGIIALVLASQAKREIEADPGRFNNPGSATAGIVLGIIDLAAGVLFFMLIL
jgi:hypothetical protein